MSNVIVLDDDDDRVLVDEKLTIDELLIEEVSRLSGHHPFLIVSAINHSDPYTILELVDAYLKGLALIEQAGGARHE